MGAFCELFLLSFFVLFFEGVFDDFWESFWSRFGLLWGAFWTLLGHFFAFFLDVCSRCSLRGFFAVFGVPRPPADVALTHAR